MKIEFALNRAGLWWSGLGFSVHIERDQRAAGEPFAWASSPSSRGCRQFRLGGLAGAVSRG